MPLPLATLILYGLAALGVAVLLLELYALWKLPRRTLPTPRSYPSFSVLKPLCGLDDELLLNLESHLAVDYPGDWEVLLGVRSNSDLAYPLAREFAAAHPDRVRLVVQQGEPGHNPKVNQLITLTREARFELIAVTDSNVRVPPNYLREHAALLEDPSIGLTSHDFAGAGERRLGAIFDNMTLASFLAPSIAVANVVLHIDQVVGKSIALRREVLKEIGGWHELKDVLAEDQRMGVALQQLGLRTAVCPTPVLSIQRDQPLSYYWGRYTRWAMIRFRVLIPGVLFEPLLNTVVVVLVGTLLAADRPVAWAILACAILFSMAFTQTAAVLARGYGFSALQLLLIPFRDLLFFFTWLRGATLRQVTWRGNRLLVLAKTRLAAPDALARARKLGKAGH
jgi:ceramide glucosyltransferase